MLRTNSRRALDNLRAYIVDHTEDADTGYIPSSFDEAARMIWDAFNAEYMGNESQRRYNLRTCGSWQGAFVAWCSGLPSTLDTSYYLHSATEDLGAILEETEEERARYSETEAEDLLSRLIYREVSKAVSR